MANDLIPFKLDETTVRGYEKEGDHWFVVSDILNMLKLQRNSLAKIPNKWKGVKVFTTPGGKQKMATINEPGLWKLVMRSNLPEAQRFQDWLAEEVIPSLRKYGEYRGIREGLKPTYKDIASNVFGIMGSKQSGITATERVANFINKAVIGMTAKQCKEKYGLAPREYLMKALRAAQSEGKKSIEKHYSDKLAELDSVQHIVDIALKSGKHPLEIKDVLKTIGYNI